MPLQRLTIKQGALETAINVVSEAQTRLNAATLAQEREAELRKARLEVLEQFVSENLNDAKLRLPAETPRSSEPLNCWMPTRRSPIL